MRVLHQLRRALNLAVVALAASAVVVTPAQAAPTVDLPAGKRNFVVVVMGDKFEAAWVRLAQYAFADDGTLVETFWYWSQASFTDDLRTGNRVSSGYATHGCPTLCTVRTPKGFARSTPAKTQAGTWRWDVNHNLIINWGTHNEAWRVGAAPAGLARLDIITSNYGVTKGSWGFGSNASFDVGGTIDDVKAAGKLTGAEHRNAYGFTTVTPEGDYHRNFASYTRCAGSPCLQNPNQGWKANLAGNPARDGRRMYFDNQVYRADEIICPTNPDGHTIAYLQIVDDNGHFRGFVGAESSLIQHQRGGAYIGSEFELRS